VPSEAQNRLSGALRRAGHISLSLLYLPCSCCSTGSREALTLLLYWQQRGPHQIW